MFRRRARATHRVVRIAGCLVLATVAVAWGPWAPAASAAAPLVGPLRVANGQVYDQSGRVILRGLNFNGPEGAVGIPPTTYFPDHPAIDHMQAWGSNMIRLPLSEDYWNAAATLNDPTLARQVCPGQVYDKTYADRVKDTVDYATRKGMLVLIDLHSTNPGCVADPRTNQGGVSAPLPGPGAQTFWSDVVSKYGSYPLVAFELYNEPHVCFVAGQAAQGPNGAYGCPERSDRNDEHNAALWAGGGATKYGNTTYQGVGMESLLTRVRAQTNNLMFVDANLVAGDAYTFATDTFANSAIAADPNVVLVGHMYLWKTELETCDYVKSTTDWFTYWATSRVNKPIVWDEFGTADPNNAVPNRLMVDVFNTEGAFGQGWAAFAFTATPDSAGNQVNYALLKRGGVEPDDASPAGQPVKDALRGTYPGTCTTSTPKPATLVTAAPANNGAMLTWTPPSDATSDAVEYTINYQNSGGATQTTPARCHKDDLLTQVNCNAWLLTGLSNDEPYTIWLTATNQHGSSTSNSLTVSPHDVAPNEPQSVVAQSGNRTGSGPTYTPSDPTITVTWAAPIPNGGSPLLSYTVEAQTHLGDVWQTQYTFANIAPTATVFLAHIRTPGLYRMVVTANNAAGGTPGYPPWDQTQSQWQIAPA